ncbi:MAG: (Fe-S)-binding protein [Planctomycetota bacterium]
METEQALKHQYDAVLRCNRCGFCQTACPTYAITGVEASVARGRNILCRNVLEHRISLTKDLYAPLFECLLCRACTAHCFPAVRTDEIVVAARNAYYREHGEPAILRFLFREFLPNRRRMTHYMRFLTLGKRTGLSGLVRLTRILGLFGKQMMKAEQLVEKAPRRFLQDILAEMALTPPRVRARVAYFNGCAINYAMPEVGAATVEFLTRNGCDVIPFEHCCCGLPAYSYGDLDAVRTMARQNIEAFEKLDADVILTDCSSCSSFLKEYPKRFEGDDEMRTRAEKVAARVRDFTEFAAELEPEVGPMSEGARITFHDPCHLSRYQKITKPPRDLIRATDGAEYVEMPEADWCCGGAGSYCIMHYDLSEKTLDRKMGNLETTGARILATTCPSCIMHLRYGVSRRRLPVRVLHLSQVLTGKGGPEF